MLNSCMNKKHKNVAHKNEYPFWDMLLKATDLVFPIQFLRLNTTI